MAQQQHRQVPAPPSGQMSRPLQSLYAAPSLKAFGRGVVRAALATLPASGAARVWWAEDTEPVLLCSIPDEQRGWASAATRISVARDRTVRKIRSRSTLGRAVALLPLSAEGALGVLEVQGDRRDIDDALATLASLAALAAPAPVMIESRRRQAAIAAAFELGRSVTSSKDGDEGARRVVRFIAGTFDAPALLWRADDANELRLVAQSGIPVAARRSLRKLRSVPLWDSLSSKERSLRRSAVEDLIGPGELYHEEHLVLYVGAVPATETTTVALAAAFLVQALSRVGSRVFEAAAQRQLDLAVAVAAHEIRSPLLGVEAALGIVLGRSTVERADRDLLRRSRADIRRLLSETKPLLVPSAGKGISSRRTVDLLSVTSAATDLVTKQMGSVNVSISGERGLTVHADAASLRRAVTNIVRNALIYAGDGEVRVKVARDGGHAIIRVSDVGPGIPRRDRASIFDPFVRGSSGRRAEGSGLGLFVARLAVESHGGSLALRSGSRGSAFTIRLPLDESGGVTSSAS